MNENSYIASVEEVIEFLTELKIILSSKTCFLDILLRKSDEDSLDSHTTENTIADLSFDSEDVKAELLGLSVNEYIETILDNKDSNRPAFWVFGRCVRNKDVYIKLKIRDKINNKIFCVSFHYPRFPLKQNPYA